MATGQAPKSIVPAHRSASLWAGLGSLAAGIAQFAGVVPDPFRKYVVGGGLILAGLSGMFGRNEGPR